MAAGDFKVIQAGRVVNFPVGATALNWGEAVAISSGALIPATDGLTVFGIALISAAASATQCPVMIDGVVRCVAATGVNFAPGDPVYMAASGQVDTGSTNNLSVGIVVNNDPASASTAVDIWLTTGTTGRITHA